MIKMIFEGGYIYNMTNGEYYVLIAMAVIGVGTVAGGCLTAFGYLSNKIKSRLNFKRKA